MSKRQIPANTTGMCLTDKHTHTHKYTKRKIGQTDDGDDDSLGVKRKRETTIKAFQN